MLNPPLPAVLRHLPDLCLPGYTKVKVNLYLCDFIDIWKGQWSGCNMAGK